MSTAPNEAVSVDQPLSSLLFDYRGADIILRSQDRYHFRILKAFIIHNSPILDEIIQKALDSPGNANAEVSLPVVQLPERGEILRYLLTFIYPVTPLLPSAPEEIMELLSVAQKYRMETALTHIRGSISRQNSLPTGLEATLHIYALAQKYGLRPEALQTARTILSKQSFLRLEDFENKFDILSGASLYELRRYRERVQAILSSDLIEFAASGAGGTISGLRCTNLSSSHIPSWLNTYIMDIISFPNVFDSAGFSVFMARHIKERASAHGCECAFIPSQTIRKFWEALTSVVDGSFEKAESALSLVWEQEDPEVPLNSATPPFEPFDVPDANFIIRSSDSVNFRVHKSVLALASPFFKDLLSLPQPSDSETVDGLPVVQLSENSELLNSLVSMLYPVSMVIPKSYEKVLYLLAACQKYEMASVQSSIRAEVSRGACPVAQGDDVFAAYAIASANGLIPEMENAARLTLNCCMTFETIGEGLRSFEGWALRDLDNFRKRCRENLVACLESFLDAQPSGPSSTWVGCPEAMPYNQSYYQQNPQRRALPRWLNQLLSGIHSELKIQVIARPLDIHSRIRQEYFTAFNNRAACSFCSGVNRTNGLIFCAELENTLAQALDKESVRPLSNDASV